MTAAARRLLVPGLMTACMLAGLLALGTWQVGRLAWKEALLTQVERAEAAAPIPLPRDPPPFAKVVVTGTFLPDRSALYGAEVRDLATGPVMGARLIVPLRDGGGQTILVDRGWVPLSRPEPVDQPAGAVTVAGYVRPGDRAGWFSAQDDGASRRFFTLDPATIGAAIGFPDVPPFILVALAAPGPDGHWPVPAAHLPRPSNRHLSYAVTWYGLALALLLIFVLWARKGSRA